jgi:hypothetical protein
MKICMKVTETTTPVPPTEGTPGAARDSRLQSFQTAGVGSGQSAAGAGLTLAILPNSWSGFWTESAAGAGADAELLHGKSLFTPTYYLAYGLKRVGDESVTNRPACDGSAKLRGQVFRCLAMPTHCNWRLTKFTTNPSTLLSSHDPFHGTQQPTSADGCIVGYHGARACSGCHLFGHEPGGGPAWTSTRDPASVSAGSQARDPDPGD